MLGIALLAQTMVSLVGQGVPTLAPFIQADLGLTRAQVGLCNSAVMGGAIVALTTAGWVVDVHGERIALAVGNLIVGVFCVAIVWATTFPLALVILFASGIGSAFPTPAGSRTVLQWFPIAQRGAAMGIRQTGIPLGGALAAALLPALAVTLGWRAALAIGGGLCVIVSAVCWYGYRQAEGNAVVPQVAHTRARFTDLPLREVMLLGAASGFATLGQFALLTYLAIFLREAHGVPVTTSAGLLVGAQIAGAGGRVLWGIWSDRYFAQRRRPPFLWAIFLSTAGAVALGWLPHGTPLWVIGLLIIAYAFNALGWHGNWVTLIAEMVGPQQQGRALGIAMMFTYTGVVVLPPLFGLLVDYTNDWRLAWTCLAGVLLLGSLLVLRVQEEEKH
jgi:MFS family permease